MTGDPQQPVAKRRITFKVAQTLPGGEKNLLDHIVNQISSRHQASPDVGVDGISIEGYPFACSFAVFAQYASDEIFLMIELNFRLPRFRSLAGRRRHTFLSRFWAAFPPFWTQLDFKACLPFDNRDGSTPGCIGVKCSCTADVCRRGGGM